MNKLSLVWINKGHEEYWIRTIFKELYSYWNDVFVEVNYELVEYDGCKDFLKEYSDGDKVCVIINNPKNNKLKRVIDKNIPFFMFNLGDEFIPSKQDHSLYDNPLCLHVFRNYYKPEYEKDKITTFALGFGKPALDKSYSINKGYRRDCSFSRDIALNNFWERELLFSFAGVLRKSGRRKAVERFKALGNHSIHSCKSWMSEDKLNSEEYIKLLQKSDITLCPRGNFNLDSFRIYEALDHGSIPLIEKFSPNQPRDYFERVLGKDCPLIKIPDLNSPEAIDFVKKIRDDIEYKNDLREQIGDWWFDDYSFNLTKKISDIIL